MSALRLAVLLAALAALVIAAPPTTAVAQTRAATPAAAAKPWAPPRTPWGHPDLQGTYTDFEYGCHEGNYGLRNILSAARAEEKAAGPR